MGSGASKPTFENRPHENASSSNISESKNGNQDNLRQVNAKKKYPNIEVNQAATVPWKDEGQTANKRNTNTNTPPPLNPADEKGVEYNAIEKNKFDMRDDIEEKNVKKLEGAVASNKPPSTPPPPKTPPKPIPSSKPLAGFVDMTTVSNNPNRNPYQNSPARRAGAPMQTTTITPRKDNNHLIMQSGPMAVRDNSPNGRDFGLTGGPSRSPAGNNPRGPVAPPPLSTPSSLRTSTSKTGQTLNPPTPLSSKPMQTNGIMRPQPTQIPRNSSAAMSSVDYQDEPMWGKGTASEHAKPAGIPSLEFNSLPQSQTPSYVIQQAPLQTIQGPMRNIGSNGIFSPPPMMGQSPMKVMGKPLPPSGETPHAVKETKAVRRNHAQLPSKLTHAKPTTGDWLKKRYIVNNYILLDTLGSGSYGEVRLCKERTTDNLFAMKIISKEMLKKQKSGTSETYFEDIKREIAIMKKLSHPNVLRLFEVLDDPKVNKLYLVLEYMKQGDLVNVLRNREIEINGGENNTNSSGDNTKPPAYTLLSDLELWNIFHQVVKGIAYLHYQNIVHGDIKPQNLLIREDGVVKIADFGISKMLSAPNQKLVDASGTPAFMSPEICCFKEGDVFSGQLADVWAIGATIYMLRFGNPPFVAGTIVSLYKKIQNDPVTFPLPIDPGLQDLIERMLAKDPNERYTLQQVVMHPWMRVPPSSRKIPTVRSSQGSVHETSQGNNPKINLNPTTMKSNAKDIGFVPPASYAHEEAKAMQEPIQTVSHGEIYESIGVGERKLQKRKDKSSTNSPSNMSGIADLKEVDESKINELENNEIQAMKDNNMLATNWGDDVFEMVDDGGNDDDDSVDEDVDDGDGDDNFIDAEVDDEDLGDDDSVDEEDDDVDADDEDAEADEKEMIKKAIGNDRKSESKENDKPLSANVKGKLSARNEVDEKQMSNEEEEMRAKRFQSRMTKKSCEEIDRLEFKYAASKNSFNTPPHLTPLNSNLDELKLAGAMVEEEDNHLKSKKILSKFGSNGMGQNLLKPPVIDTSGGISGSECPTPDHMNLIQKHYERDSNLDFDIDDEDATKELSMDDFSQMMDTLHLQSRSKKVKKSFMVESDTEPIEAKYSSGDLKTSARFTNNTVFMRGSFATEQGTRVNQEDRLLLVANVGEGVQVWKQEGTFTKELSEEQLSMLRKFSIGGVFDGHNGWLCSEYLSSALIPTLVSHPKFLAKSQKESIMETFEVIENKVCDILEAEGDSSGSTANVVVYDGRRNVITVANVGDSMCVLCRGGKAVPMLTPHRLDSMEESARIEAAGGFIKNNRVNGVLAISRAFGDNQFKTRRSEKNMRSLVIAIPEITTELVTPMTEFLIIASDGLWDVMSPQTAVNFVRNSFSKRHNLEEAAQLLVREAIAIGSVDNVSAVIMSFHLPDTENT